MLRLAINRGVAPIALLPFFGGPSRNDAVPEDKLAEITPIRVGMDKVKDFFIDENGYTTKELQSVINTTAAGMVIGFIIGGVAKSRFVTENFIADNQAAIFKNHYEAKRLLHYKVAVAICKGGLPFSFKLGTFCFLFSGTAAALQVYKGKFDPLNHVIGGAIAGAVYKTNMGLKGAVAGCVLGTILGAISGSVASIILYVTGTEMGDLYKASNKWINARQDIIHEQRKFLNEEHKQFKQAYDDHQNMRKAMYEDEKQEQ